LTSGAACVLYLFVTADESVLLLNDPLLYGLDLRARTLLGAVARLILGLALMRKLVAITVRQPPGLSVLFANRMARTARLLQAMVAAYQAGTLKPPRPRKPANAATGASAPAGPDAASPAAFPAAFRGDSPAHPDSDPAPAVAPPEKLSLPRGRGWLGRLVPRVGHVSGGLLQLMAEPEVLAFLEAAPQAGRLLRPLYWMIGMKLPPALQLPKREHHPPAADRVAAERTAAQPAGAAKTRSQSYAQRLRAALRGTPSLHTRIPSADWESSYQHKRRRRPRDSG
jgi:hypothetical protein